jgi:DNA-binding transcriptional ArsR family regulator
MSSTVFEPVVREVMPPPQALAVELFASSACELLIGASILMTEERPPDAAEWVRDAVTPSLHRAILGVGEHAGELWLHLLGIPLETGAHDARAFLGTLESMNGLELRRHLVGVFVPAWQELVGAATLERAAAGDARAAAKLFAHDRYYAGRARQSLALLLPLTPAETKRRLLAVLRRLHADVFAAVEPHVADVLARDAEAKEQQRRVRAPLELIAAATGGYVYEPEPEFRRVVLVPHLAARPWLLLCQHRDARVICYPVSAHPVDAEEAVRERALQLGRALGDERRLYILRRLARGDATLGDLAEHAGLVKSTAHHHLAQLRAAGLVTLQGNAREYRYSLRRAGFAEARATLAELTA